MPITPYGIALYGIPNCDTVKTARNWLDANGIAYGFHDDKKAGVDQAKLESWCKVPGWETICLHGARPLGNLRWSTEACPP